MSARAALPAMPAEPRRQTSACLAISVSKPQRKKIAVPPMPSQQQRSITSRVCLALLRTRACKAAILSAAFRPVLGRAEYAAIHLNSCCSLRASWRSVLMTLIFALLAAIGFSEPAHFLSQQRLLLLASMASPALNCGRLGCACAALVG